MHFFPFAARALLVYAALAAPSLAAAAVVAPACAALAVSQTAGRGRVLSGIHNAAAALLLLLAGGWWLLLAPAAVFMATAVDSERSHRAVARAAGALSALTAALLLAALLLLSPAAPAGQRAVPAAPLALYAVASAAAVRGAPPSSWPGAAASVAWQLLLAAYTTAGHSSSVPLLALGAAVTCSGAVELRAASDDLCEWLLRHDRGASLLLDVLLVMLCLATCAAAALTEPAGAAPALVLACPAAGLVTAGFVVFGPAIFKLLCGNGVLEALEQCDDGNVFRYDGCSATCNFEDTCGCDAGTQWLCTDTPMQLSVCCESLLNPITLQRTCSCAGQASGSALFSVTAACAKRDINECLANPCAANALCFNSDGTAPGASIGHSCVCPPGLVGDGVSRCDVKVYKSITQYIVSDAPFAEFSETVTRVSLLAAPGALPANVTSSSISISASPFSTSESRRRLLDAGDDALGEFLALFNASSDSDGDGRRLLQSGSGSDGGLELTVVITSPDALGMLATTTSWNTAATVAALAALYNSSVQLSQPPTSLVQTVEQAGSAISTVLSGFAVQSIVYNETAMTWVVRVRYQDATPHTIASLYVSKVGSPPPYSRAVQDTFFVSRHPCMQDATVCCLLDYRDRYVIGALADNITAAVGACGAEVQARATRGLIGTDANAHLVEHLFDDFPRSRVVRHSPSVVELHINRFDLRNNFTTRTVPTTGGVEFEFFVGMSYFTTLPANALAAVASQARITIVESDSITLATSSDRDYSFLQFMTVSLFQTKYVSDAFFTHYPQLVKVSFVLPADLAQNMRTGLIPLTSVRFAVETTLPDVQDAVKWKTSCFSASETGLYDDTVSGGAPNPLRALYSAAATQDCALQEPLCMNPPAAQLASRLVEFYFPIGDDAVSDAVTQAAQTHFLFVHFDLSVVDSAGRGSITKLFAQAPITELSVSSYCEALSAARDLSDIADVSLAIGSAGVEAEWQASVVEFSNALADAEELLETGVDVQARSVQAGLISLVVHGTEAAFASPFAADFHLELDALTTLHFLDDVKYQQVAAAMQAGTAWAPARNAVSGHTDIALSAAVEQICASAAMPGDVSCAIRRGVQSRLVSVASAVHPLATGVGTRDAGADREWLVEHSLRGSSDFSREYAQNFTSLLRAHYNINDRYRKAWFVNPGYPWSVTGGAQSALELSDRMILIAVVSLDDGNPLSRRRVLLESTDGRRVHARALLQEPGAEAVAGALRTVAAMEETPLQGRLPTVHNVQVDGMRTAARALGIDTETEMWSAVRIDVQALDTAGATALEARDALQERLRARRADFAPTATRLFLAQYGIAAPQPRTSVRQLLTTTSDGYVTLMIVFGNGTNPLWTSALFDAIYALPGGDESYAAQNNIARGLLLDRVRVLNQTATSPASFARISLAFDSASDGVGEWLGEGPPPLTPPPPPPPAVPPATDDEFFGGGESSAAGALRGPVTLALTLALALFAGSL